MKWVHTSDVHGRLLAREPAGEGPATGGMARIGAYVEACRREAPDGLVLTDGGDMLQGRPEAYYASHVDRSGTHWMADVMNRMRYDAACIGNHDLEEGHAVYDRWVAQCRFPVLGANVVRDPGDTPYFRPYVMLERCGVRIAVLGLLTPVVPYWQPETAWKGMRFEELTACARRWVERIRREERPHLMVALLHSGKEGGMVTPYGRENAARQVAREVEGLDMVCYGHDHLPDVETVDGPHGNRVLCMAPAPHGQAVCEADMELVLQGDCLTEKHLSGRIVRVDEKGGEAGDGDFETVYADRIAALKQYVDSPLGRFEQPMRCRDAFFGPSVFIDWLHRVQLRAVGAQLSLAAPPALDAGMERGVVRVGDLFRLYKYEDRLCVLRLSGREMRGILEMSYGMWIRQMRGPQEELMRLGDVSDGGRGKRFVHPVFDFDTAAGILYTVDVTRAPGERVHIRSLASGEPFEPERMYTVAVNSHRACGGGELLTRGAGIPQGELAGRVVRFTGTSLRELLMATVRDEGRVAVEPLHHWRFVPEEWAQPACRRDRKALFGNET